MQHQYSDQLIAYLFKEIDPNTKENLERELSANEHLRAELADLQSSLNMIKECAPLSPSTQTVQNILEATKTEEAIPAG